MLPARIIHEGVCQNRQGGKQDRRIEPREMEVYMNQEVDQPNGEPPAVRSVRATYGYRE
jgi:hypothetical protein